MENKYQFFWTTMERCDWEEEGDDDLVLKPVIKYLSQQEDNVIFQFDDLMSELLYALDDQNLADKCQDRDPRMCDDSFLYCRCVALINGPDYYEAVKEGRENSLWDLEFESLIYVPQKAWALKHQSFIDEYPHYPPCCIETGSNPDGWK